MTYRELLAEGTGILEGCGTIFCDTPSLDSSVLLAFAAGISREKLLAAYSDDVPPEAAETFRKLIKKRTEGYPVSYIRRVKEFFGRDFYVDERVLVPRPETEIMVEKVIGTAQSLRKAAGSVAGSRPLKILDLCTGSGCIAVTLKKELPDAEITASDISAEALEVARKNGSLHEADISFLQSNLFDELSGKFDIIVTNPPYVEAEVCDGMQEGRWPEPRLALDGGADGLDIIRIIVESSMDYLTDNSYLLIEAGWTHSEEIRNLMKEAGFTGTDTLTDLAGKDRVTFGRCCGSQDNEIRE